MTLDGFLLRFALTLGIWVEILTLFALVKYLSGS